MPRIDVIGDNNENVLSDANTVSVDASQNIEQDQDDEEDTDTTFTSLNQGNDSESDVTYQQTGLTRSDVQMLSKLIAWCQTMSYAMEVVWVWFSI